MRWSKYCKIIRVKCWKRIPPPGAERRALHATAPTARAPPDLRPSALPPRDGGKPSDSHQCPSCPACWREGAKKGERGTPAAPMAFPAPRAPAAHLRSWNPGGRGVSRPRWCHRRTAVSWCAKMAQKGELSSQGLFPGPFLSFSVPPTEVQPPEGAAVGQSLQPDPKSWRSPSVAKPPRAARATALLLGPPKGRFHRWVSEEEEKDCACFPTAVPLEPHLVPARRIR